MKKKYIHLLFLLLSIISTVIIIFGITYSINTKSVSKDSKVRHFTVEEGSSYSGISSQLKEANLIKSEFFYKFFLKLNQPKLELEPGLYNLKENMNIKEIISSLGDGASKRETVMVTFREGLHMRNYTKIISEFSTHSYEEVLAFTTNEKYLNELIDSYFFFTDEILNKDLYYPLEGYLFPETYEFYKDSTLNEIFEVILTQTEKELKEIKEDIKNFKYYETTKEGPQITVHEFLTLASIIELEASSNSDRQGVAGVFINRLVQGFPLGSDVTTYYAEKLEMYERDLTMVELNSVNPYNTRSDQLAGKLPVGPIGNPGKSSYEAVLKYKRHDYLYFVADKNGKSYFAKNYAEHIKVIDKLKEQGLWFEH